MIQYIWHKNVRFLLRIFVVGVMVAPLLSDVTNHALPDQINTQIQLEQKESACDLINFSYNRPMQLYAFLESIFRYVIGLGVIQVIYRADTDAYETAYQEIARSFPTVKFLRQDSILRDNFKTVLLSALDKSSHQYIVFAVDDIIIKDYIDIRVCCRMLQETNAYGFSLRSGKNTTFSYAMNFETGVPPLTAVAPGIYSWLFSDGLGDWRYPNMLDMTIFRRRDIDPILHSCNYSSPQNLEKFFLLYDKTDQSGLCFECSKIIKIPLDKRSKWQERVAFNVVDQLLDLFNQRLRINIERIHNLTTNSYYTEFKPDFTQRQFSHEMVPLIPCSEDGATIDHSNLPIDELEFVIITPSYNNVRWHQRNVDSLLFQNYHNYKIIYVDDLSPDGTAQFVERHVQMRNGESKVTLIKNTQRVGALENIYNAVHSCNDNTIIVLVDGDDWLSHTQVLTKLNVIYHDPAVWMTYGQFIHYPYPEIAEYRALDEKIIQQHSYRAHPWTTSHLRTFRAWLFKKIKKEDLVHEDGRFYQVTWDQAFMFPMLEMAGYHSRFINEVLYVYNIANPLNDNKVHRDWQNQCEQQIRGKTPYAMLEHQ